MTLTREEFATLESEMERVQELTGIHVPSTTVGASKFFAELPAWIYQGENRSLDNSVVVLPDPSANLSLPYPTDELSLSLSLAGKIPQPKTQSELTNLAQGFGLSEAVLERPTTALSGGERMLVSLCKALILALSADVVVVLCSPYFWLDPKNRNLIKDRFSDGVTTQLLVLSGEDDPESEYNSLDLPETKSPVTWHLRLEDALVIYPPLSFPKKTERKEIHFSIKGTSLELASPTLIRGPNGVGKTTLANLLAGILKPDSGNCSCVSGGIRGKARLILQDSVMQLFGQSIRGNIERIFRFDKDWRKKARQLYESLENSCMESAAEKLPGVALGESDAPRSLLQCKIALAVDRMFGNPPLMILDEPGWGLSKDVAQAFVEAVANEAHTRGIAVAIISHQGNWWEGIIRDVLDLRLDEPSSSTRSNVLLTAEKT